MDRAQELRTLMKFASKKDDSKSNNSATALTGKDKAKLLKQMKEKQKAESEVKLSVSQPNKPKPVQSVTNTTKPVLPSNFFDDAPPAAASIVAPTKAVTTVQTSSVHNNTAAAPPVSVNTQLPVGFFDNPTEELTARGVDIKQHQAEQQKIIDNEFQSFMSEIEVLKEDADEVAAEEHGQEAEGKDYEEEALQMAYMTKLAVLYKQSDAVIDRRGRNTTNTDQSNGDLTNAASDVHELLGSSDTVNNDVLSDTLRQEADAKPAVVREDVQSILYRKLQLENLKKRRLQQASAAILADSKRSRQADISNQNNNNDEQEEEDEENESSGSEEDDEDDDEDDDYSPLDFMNWTNKGV